MLLFFGAVPAHGATGFTNVIINGDAETAISGVNQVSNQGGLPWVTMARQQFADRQPTAGVVYGREFPAVLDPGTGTHVIQLTEPGPGTGIDVTERTWA